MHLSFTIVILSLILASFLTELHVVVSSLCTVPTDRTNNTHAHTGEEDQRDCRWPSLICFLQPNLLIVMDESQILK